MVFCAPQVQKGYMKKTPCAFLPDKDPVTSCPIAKTFYQSSAHQTSAIFLRIRLFLPWERQKLIQAGPGLYTGATLFLLWKIPDLCVALWVAAFPGNLQSVIGAHSFLSAELHGALHTKIPAVLQHILWAIER